MLPKQFELRNGVRVIYQEAGKSKVSHIALLIHAGTRNEKHGKEGLAHFIEHVFFKGTRNRKSFHILNRLDSVGGELNAFTSKEETCLYASVMNQHTERAIELISDIFFNSIFPERELEKEKQVIADEIRTYEDTPSEQIQDDFESQIFSNHGLGNPVLGTIESLQRISRQDIFDFIKENYLPHKIVLSIVSDLPFENFKKHAIKYFSASWKTGIESKSTPFQLYKSSQKKIAKPINQSHIVLGNLACSFHDPDRFTMALLNNILGGPGMNSRLNLHIREKYGYTYQIDSNYIPYSDTGLFTVYFATDFKNVHKTMPLVFKELERFYKEKISALQLKKYQEQFIGQLTISYENKAGLAFSAAKSLLCFNKIDGPEKIKESIEAVTSSRLIHVAKKVFDHQQLSSLHFYPNSETSPY